MSLRLLSDVERRVLLDALDDYLDVDPWDAAEMEPWLSTAEGLYTAVDAGGLIFWDDPHDLAALRRELGGDQ